MPLHAPVVSHVGENTTGLMVKFTYAEFGVGSTKLLGRSRERDGRVVFWNDSVKFTQHPKRSSLKVQRYHPLWMKVTVGGENTGFENEFTRTKST